MTTIDTRHGGGEVLDDRPYHEKYKHAAHFRTAEAEFDACKLGMWLFLATEILTFSGMFVVALKMSLPVVATVFIVTVSLGILAKAAPQMNIMMLGFPFKIMVSFAVLFLTAPLIVRVMNVSLERSFNFITRVLYHWPS